jgi:hypothetical protein
MPAGRGPRAIAAEIYVKGAPMQQRRRPTGPAAVDAVAASAMLVA